MPSEPILPSDIEREKQVREIIIEKNAGISHNALLKIVVDEKKLMARKTFAKTVKSLLQSKLISYRQEKNKKIYFETSTSDGLNDLERILKKQETELPESSKAFGDLTLDAKAAEAKFIFGLFSANIEFYNVMFALGKTSPEEFTKRSTLLRQFLRIHLTKWSKDKDSEYLIAEIFKTIVKTNPFFESMVKILRSELLSK